MSDQSTQETGVQGLKVPNLMAGENSSKPKDQLLKSYNIFKIENPQELLKNPTRCVAHGKEIPADAISQSGTETFIGQYREQSSSRETNREFSTSVGIKGKYGVFSASMQMDYSKSEATKSTSFFSSYTAKLDIGTLSYQADKEDTLALLNPKMVSQLNAIDSMAKAKDFTEQWGTHMITRIGLGGMLFVGIEASTSSIESKESLSSTIKMKYGALNSLSAVAKVVTEMSSSQETKSVLQTVYALGGSAVAGGSIDPTDKTSFQNWIKTCGENTVYSIVESVEIFTLASGNANTLLKRYIDLSMLAYSLEHPTVFLEQKNIVAYATNTITSPGKYIEGYKIIGGGASASRGSSSYLYGSYPQVTNGKPTAWHAVSHDAAIAADPRDVLSSYAIAVYDPGDYLDVMVATAVGTNTKVGGDSAEARLGGDWVMTCGGINNVNKGTNAKFFISSYPTDAHGWKAEGCDYKRAAENVELTAYAVGIKSKDPLLRISATQVEGPAENGQHGHAFATSPSCLCGGGVRVWNNRGMGNLIQTCYPFSPTKWEEGNHDLDGSVSPAEYRAYAVFLRATLGV